MSSATEQLERAFVAACEAELVALKPGNVHVHAEGHGMTVEDFRRSAAAAAAPLCRPGTSVGARIRDAVAASWAAVPCNTNLGIVLLAAPLLAAAERGTGALRDRLARVLDELTIEDARDAFAAIAHANPGGLGRVREADVAAAPTVTLREGMRLAAERDRIARQYVSGYANVFAIGVPRLRAAAAPDAWTTTLVFLDFLAAFGDSHIARKYGAATAESVRAEAAALRASLPPARHDAVATLLRFDADLKRRGLNPGTSADLTVAALLVVRLERT